MNNEYKYSIVEDLDKEGILSFRVMRTTEASKDEYLSNNTFDDSQEWCCSLVVLYCRSQFWREYPSFEDAERALRVQLERERENEKMEKAAYSKVHAINI